MNRTALFLVVLLLGISGCDLFTDPEKKELEAFKTNNSLQFQGKVMGQEINWKYANWENGIGTLYGSNWCVTEDKNVHQKNFSIYDTEQRDDIYSLGIIFPAFNINDKYENKKMIFDVGSKSFHSLDDSVYDGFTVLVKTKEMSFSTQFGEQEESSFEVVKIQEWEADGVEKMKLWVLISCDLYSGTGEYYGKIENGQVIGMVELE